MSVDASISLLRSFHADFERGCQEREKQRVILDAKTARVLTYGALFESVQGFCEVLRQAGVTSSDRLFSVLPNSVEQLIACLAALWSGVDFCPISPLSTPEEIHRFIRLCDGAVGLAPYNIEPTLAGELRASSRKKSLICVETNGDVTHYLGEAKGGATHQPAESGKLILFTSGTTASPKAMVLSGDRLWSSAVAWAGFHESLDEEARFYNILPMSYLGGLFNLGLIPLATGGSVVISDSFSAVSMLKFWREVEELGVNVLWLAPTMVRSLLRLHRPVTKAIAPWKDIRVAFVGMAGIRLHEKDEFEATFGIPLLENYALSETTFLTSEKEGQSTGRAPGSVGSVLPWVRMRVESRFEESPLSEIQVKTPFLFDGYLTSTGTVELPLTVDGWFATGDLGHLNGDVLTLDGRCKDIVKKGGYLLSLRDLEEVAETHPAVAEAAAVGIEHPFYGESAALCVILSQNADAPAATLREVKELLTRKISKFKWPTEIHVVSSFPRSETGKVQKHVIADRLKEKEGILESIQIH